MQSKLVSESQRCVVFCDGHRFQLNENCDLAGCNDWAILREMVSHRTCLAAGNFVSELILQRVENAG